MEGTMRRRHKGNRDEEKCKNEKGTERNWRERIGEHNRDKHQALALDMIIQIFIWNDNTDNHMINRNKLNLKYPLKKTGRLNLN